MPGLLKEKEVVRQSPTRENAIERLSRLLPGSKWLPRSWPRPLGGQPVQPKPLKGRLPPYELPRPERRVGWQLTDGSHDLNRAHRNSLSAGLTLLRPHPEGGEHPWVARVVILAVIPPNPTAANQTALNGMPYQP